MYVETWRDSRSTEAVINAALISAELGRPDESVQLLEQAGLEIQKNYSIGFELGWLYANRGDWEKLSDLLDKQKIVLSSHPYINLLQARLFLHQNNNAAALKSLEGFVGQNPKLTLGHYFLGIANEKNDQVEKAIASYQQILKEDSHFVEARPILASLFEKNKNFDDAWRHHARIMGADSRNVNAREGMGRLASSITKKPEEIVSPRKITSHNVKFKITDRDKSPRIRVGIGTNSGGEPSVKKKLVFRTSKPFSFWDPETNKELRSGTALSTWTIRLDGSGSFAEILDSNGKYVGRFSRTIVIRQSSPDPSSTIIQSLEFAPNTSWGGLADKEIRGDIEVILNRIKKSLVIVNHLSIEEYLYGVLSAEMPSHWPMEALKAQAVIARTQGLYRKGLHKKFGYDICDEQHCQVYTGVAVESDRVREAVDGTKGEYLNFNGKPAHTVFSSNCGGVTQSGGQAGWGDVHYWHSIGDAQDSLLKPMNIMELRQWLQENPAVFCKSSQYTWHPEFRWTRVVKASDISAKISRKKEIGTLLKIQILERNASGRVQKIRFVGTNESVTLSKEHEIRKYTGLGSLRSTFFVLDTIYEDNIPSSFIFFGGGWGHGVGLCQSGAAGRAETGQTYQQILSDYYSGTKLKKL